MGHIMNEDASQIDITHYLSKGEIQHLLPEGRHVNHLAAEIALNPDEEPYIGKHL